MNENTSSRSSGSRRALSQKQPQSQPEAKPEAEIKLNKAVVQVDKTKLRAPIRLTAADKENIQRQTTKRKTRARAQQPTYLKRKVEKTWKADEWASLFEDPFAKPSSEVSALYCVFDAELMLSGGGRRSPNPLRSECEPMS